MCPHLDVEELFRRDEGGDVVEGGQVGVLDEGELSDGASLQVHQFQRVELGGVVHLGRVHQHVGGNACTGTRWGCSSVGRAPDRHAADAGSIPRCGKGFFSQSIFSADSLTASIHPCVQLHAFTSVRT